MKKFFAVSFVILLSGGLPLAASAQSTNAVPPPQPPPPGKKDEIPSSLLHGSNVRITPEVRERLVELLELPKEKLWGELLKWPDFQQMTLQEQATFVNRLAEMRQRLKNQALRKASEMGLKISPEEEDDFVDSYMEERMELERKMWQDIQPKRRQFEQQLNENLKEEYATATNAPAATPSTAPAPTSPH